MDVILSSVKWQFSLVSPDDIFILSESHEHHKDHHRTVLTLLKNMGAVLKIKKCRFFAETIHYMGHRTRQRRREIAAHATDAIRGLRAPLRLQNSYLS